MISALAEESRGVWYQITSPGQIPDLFSKELTDMRTVVYAQPKLIMMFITFL